MKKRYVVTFGGSYLFVPSPMYFSTRLFAYVVGWLAFTTCLSATSFSVERLEWKKIS